MNPDTVVPVEKLGKFKASKMIVKESWNIFKQDKELFWFPVLSFVVSIVALIILGSVVFFVAMAGDYNAFINSSDVVGEIVSYSILFIFYLLMFLVTNYFLAGMYIIIHGRFSGQNLTFSDGINGATKLIGKIFVWSLVSATVGLILQIISDHSKIVGKIVASLLGAAWNILTYFSLPSLVIGGTTVKDSFKESAAIIRKTWGETIIVNFGVGLFFTLIIFLGLIMAVGLIIIIPTSLVMICVGILFLIFIMVVAIISSTLSSIFKLAIYEYAKTGTIPNSFTPTLVQGAVKGGENSL